MLRPKLPNKVQLLDVPVGTRQRGIVGVYAKPGVAEANVTARIAGEDADLFKVVRVEIDDVVITHEGEHAKPIATLEFAGAVDGPGPITVDAGEAVLETSERKIGQ